jgi:tetratricopeptide (TPR) repeat protein
LHQLKDFRNNLADDFIEVLPNDLAVERSASSNVQDLIEKTINIQANGRHQAVVDLLTFHIEELDKANNLAILYHLLGISLYRLDRFDDARVRYLQALQIQPNFPSALNSLGFLLQDVGFIQEAKNAFEQALKLAPELSMARLNLGMAQLNLAISKMAGKTMRHVGRVRQRVPKELFQNQSVHCHSGTQMNLPMESQF